MHFCYTTVYCIVVNALLDLSKCYLKISLKKEANWTFLSLYRHFTSHPWGYFNSKNKRWRVSDTLTWMNENVGNCSEQPNRPTLLCSTHPASYPVQDHWRLECWSLFQLSQGLNRVHLGQVTIYERAQRERQPFKLMANLESNIN